MSGGRLVCPALRWRPESGFRHEEERIAAALGAGVGGFIIFGGTAEAVAALTARLVDHAGRPLLLGADVERGAGQQFEGLTEFPPPRALGSLDDAGVIRAAARGTAEEALEVGINWVYAPVADLDVEPDNPIVQTRSFGDHPALVARAVKTWIAAAQEAGVLACAKHFPGHGRTRHDSHDGVPEVDVPAALLRSADLVPFQAAVDAGVASVMTAHVAFPALDPTGTPATYSAPILSELRGALGFGGLIVTDALIMGGAASGRSPEDGAVAALSAGVDVMLYPPDPVTMTAALEQAIGRDPALEIRAEQALARYRAALGRVGRPGAGSDHAEAARGIADRLVADGWIGTVPKLRPPIELVIVDDDVDGAWPAGPSHFLADRLRALGVPLGPGGSRVVVGLTEPRASKGRGGFGAKALERFAEMSPRASLVVLLAHPRWAAQAQGGSPVPVMVGWHRQRLMQEAAARWMAGAVR
ncbi:MAG: glycoside hydrolase family 3 N-terminal domain-containing protein [Gemmatimonadota bacterium]